MELYTNLRAFADSWGLLYMTLIFVGVVFYAFRPGSGDYYEKQARIPLDGQDRPLTDMPRTDGEINSNDKE